MSCKGVIYRMSMDLTTDAGCAIRRERVVPHISNENARLVLDSLELDAEVGTATSGDNPQVMLQVSNDGGNTWSAERWKSLGRIGRFRQRLRWLRLGMAPDRVLRFVTTTTAPVRWVNVFLKMRGGKS